MGSARYRVEWTGEAEGDALGIIGYFDGRINAERVITRFESKAEALAIFPESGRIVLELRRIGVMSYQEVVTGPWRMLYEIRGQAVFIVEVLEGRRDRADVLLERFVRP